MSYLSPQVPAPVPDIEDEPFWQAAAERRLVFQRCADCGRHRHPPSPMCSLCQSLAVAWTEAPPQGVLFSYTITHVAPHPEFRERTPYIVALVSFPALDDVRLVTNIVNAAAKTLRIGATVELVWEPLGDALYAPRFALVDGSGKEGR